MWRFWKLSQRSSVFLLTVLVRHIAPIEAFLSVTAAPKALVFPADLMQRKTLDGIG
jgi:hypothetical protein